MNSSPFSKEPGHDEIAMCAFLIWEREGRQSGRETAYWLQAEGEIRAAYQKKAEQAAALAARPWPPQPLAPRVLAAKEVKRAATPKTATKTLSQPTATKRAVKTTPKAVVKTLAKPVTKTVTTKAPAAPAPTKAAPATTVRLMPVAKPSVRASFAAANKPATRAVRRTA